MLFRVGVAYSVSEQTKRLIFLKMKKIFFLAIFAIAVCSLASCSKNLDPVLVENQAARVSDAANFEIAVSIESEGVEETTLTIMDGNKVAIQTTIVTEDDWAQGLNLRVKTKKTPEFIYSADAEGDGFVPLNAEAVVTKSGPVPVKMRLVRK